MSDAVQEQSLKADDMAYLSDDGERSSVADYEEYTLEQDNLFASKKNSYSSYISRAENFLNLSPEKNRYLPASELSEMIDFYIASQKRLVDLTRKLPKWLEFSPQLYRLLLPSCSFWLPQKMSDSESSINFNFRFFCESWVYYRHEELRCENDKIIKTDKSSKEKKYSWPPHFSADPEFCVEKDFERLDKLQFERMETRFLYPEPYKFICDCMCFNEIRETDSIDGRDRGALVDYALILSERYRMSSEFISKKNDFVINIVQNYINDAVDIKKIIKELYEGTYSSVWPKDNFDELFTFNVSVVSSNDETLISDNIALARYMPVLLQSAACITLLSLDKKLGQAIETSCRSRAVRHESFDSKRQRVLKHSSR